MAQTTLSELLTQQHRRIDEGLQDIIDGNGSHAALADSLRLLYLHIYVEEEFLFPPLEEAGLIFPVFVMKQEHGEMWPYLQQLSAACATETPIPQLQRPALSLFRILQVHNPKEEEVLYAAADRLVAEHGGAELMRTLTAARVPDGWVCAAQLS